VSVDFRGKFPRILRWLAFALVVLLSLAVLAAAWISHEGRQRLAAVRAELLARGEKLTLVELAPPPIPDAVNFFADPIWQSLPPESDEERQHATTRYRGPIGALDTPITDAERAAFGRLFPGASVKNDEESRVRTCCQLAHSLADTQALGRREQAAQILDSIGSFTPELERIHRLLDRGAARYPIDYAYNPWAKRFDPYPGIHDIGKVLFARAMAGIALGDGEASARDATDLIRLAETARLDPLLYSQMTRASLLSMAIHVIKFGTAAHVWSDEQLARIEARLRPINILAGVALGFRGDRGLHNQILERFHSGRKSQDAEVWRSSGWDSPAGIAYLTVFGPGDQAALNADVQRIVELADRAEEEGFDPEKITAISQERHWMPRTFRDTFLDLLAGNFAVAAEQQDELSQARIALALERYLLRRGHYPEGLAELAPDDLLTLPLSVHSLEPMRYERTTPDHFVLAAPHDHAPLWRE